MTRDSFLALLREIEWEGGLPEPWCEGVNPCCPSCGNEAGPHHLRAHAQHEKGCKLAAAIAWLEDEKNITNGGCCNVDGWLLEDVR